MPIKSKLLLIASMILTTLSSGTQAQEPLSTIKAFIKDDCLAIAYIDLTSVDLNHCIDWAASQNLLEPEVVPEVKKMAEPVREALRSVTDAGIEHVVAVFHPSDFLVANNDLQLFLLFSVADGHEPEQALETLKPILPRLNLVEFPMEISNGTILGGFESQIERAKTGSALEITRFTNAWKKFGGQDAGVMFFGNKDARRAIRELFPKLESPFENVTGKLIADEVDCLGLSLSLPKKVEEVSEVDGRLIVQTTNAQAAGVVNQALKETTNLLADSEFSDQWPSIVTNAIDRLEPKVESNDVVIELKPILNGIGK